MEDASPADNQTGGAPVIGALSPEDRAAVATFAAQQRTVTGEAGLVFCALRQTLTGPGTYDTSLGMFYVPVSQVGHWLLSASRVDHDAEAFVVLMRGEVMTTEVVCADVPPIIWDGGNDTPH